MTNKKQTLTEKLKNGVNNFSRGVKKGLVYASVPLIMASSFSQDSMAQNPGNTEEKSQYKIVNVGGEKDTLEAHNIHGNKILFKDAENELGKKAIDLGSCGRTTSLGEDNKSALDPNIVYKPQKVELDSGNHKEDPYADKAVFSPTGKFGLEGKGIEGSGGTNETGSVSYVSLEGLYKDLKSVDLARDGEYLYPYYNQDSAIQTGRKLNFNFIPVKGGKQNINHRGTVSVTNKNNIYEWVIDTTESNPEIYKDSSKLKKHIVNENYFSNVSGNPMTGQSIGFEEVRGLKETSLENKEDKDKKKNSEFKWFQPKVDLDGVVAGDNLYGQASFTLGFGNENLSIGPYVSYNIGNQSGTWNTGKITNESFQQKEDMIDRDGDTTRYAVTNKDVTKTPMYQNIEWGAGVSFNGMISNSLGLEGKIGVTYRNIKQQYSGEVSTDIETRDADGNVINTRELNVGDEKGDSYVENLGKEATFTGSIGAEYFPGKDNKSFSAEGNINYETGLGDKSKSESFKYGLGINYYFNR